MRMRRLPYLLLKVGCLVCLFSLFIFSKIADRAENKKANDPKSPALVKTRLFQEKTLQTKKIYNEKLYMPSSVKSGDKIDSHLGQVAQPHSETVQEEAYQTDEDPDKVRYHKGRILVKFNTQEEEQLKQGKDLNLSGTIGRMASKGGFYEITPSEGETVEELLEKYRIDFSHMVQYAQLDYECEIQGRDEPYLKRFKKNIKGLKNKKSKELEELIWYMDAINIADAWKKTSGEKSVVIAVLDTGIAFEDFIVPEYEAETVDSEHYLEIPYLKRTRIWQNEAETRDNEKDDDNNGYVDDKYGYDFVNKDVHPNDNNGHGTHLANIIGHDFNIYNNNLNLNEASSKYKAKLAQKMNKDIGSSSPALDYTDQIEDLIYGNSKTDKSILAGIAPKCTIMNLKVLNYKGKGFSSNIAEAIYYAVDNGAHVINLSFAWPPNLNPGQIIHDAIIYAANAGVIVVSGSGNNSRSTVCYPAAYEEVIAVGSIQYDYSRACYSNYGHELEIVAPGGNIWEDQNLDDFPDGVLTQTFEPRYRFSVDGEKLADPSRFMFDFIHGTSVATAQVTGIVALLLSVKPELSLANIRSIISRSALDLGPAGWDPEYGYGLIDAGKAVIKAINGDYNESPVDNNKGNYDEYDDDIIDTDDDGYSSILEGGNDCNDYDPAIYPGAAEVPYDGIDQNCDGRDLADVDNDGYISVEVGGTDCDDHNMAIHPGAPEIKGDGIDQDCDGDDNTSTSVYWIEDPDSCDGMGWEGDCDSCSSEYEIELECPKS